MNAPTVYERRQFRRAHGERTIRHAPREHEDRATETSYVCDQCHERYTCNACAEYGRTCRLGPDCWRDVCEHPPARYFTWISYDGTLCVACCDCGAVLKGAA